MGELGQRKTRRIAVVGFERAQILDIVGPLEVFGRASRLLGEREEAARAPAYAVEIIGLRAGPFATSSGLTLVAARPFARVAGGIDTLLVAGGVGVEAVVGNAPLGAWLRRMVGRVRRFGSVCTGALVLAAAGLLDGRRATTHWGSLARLGARHPRVRVDGDAIFVKDGPIYTSAGVTAGMDLALALVDEDHGPALALEVARQLVMYIRRPGGQSQFSAQLAGQGARTEPIRELQAYIAEGVAGDLSVEACARRARMSARTFARRFTAEVGTTPARYVEAARVETARRLLEESSDGVEAIAGAAGFGAAETMRRAFLRTIRVTPQDYRARFRSRAPGRDPIAGARTRTRTGTNQRKRRK